MPHRKGNAIVTSRVAQTAREQNHHLRLAMFASPSRAQKKSSSLTNRNRSPLKNPVSFFCLKATPNKVALNSERDHNHTMKTRSRLSHLFGWSVRCTSVVLALAFCGSAFAADPSKNVVLPAQPQRVTKTAKKMCYTLTSTSGIPVPCDRLSAIPTTASPMIIYGNRLGTTK